MSGEKGPLRFWLTWVLFIGPPSLAEVQCINARMKIFFCSCHFIWGVCGKEKGAKWVLTN